MDRCFWEKTGVTFPIRFDLSVATGNLAAKG